MMGAEGQLLTLSFRLSENCPKSLLLENFGPKLQNLGLKLVIPRKFRVKVEFFSTFKKKFATVGQNSAMSKICSVCWKIVTFVLPTFLIPVAAV